MSSNSQTYLPVIWHGDDLLYDSVTPITELRRAPGLIVGGDPELVREALREFGQLRPVLVGDSGIDVVARWHLVEAAISLGWTYIAVRSRTGEDSIDDLDQLSLVEVAETTDPGSVAALARKPGWREADEAETDAINEASIDADAVWVGLPEFERGTEPLKVVVSMESEEDREAFLDVFGISTIHKGTRGTLSVWWPERPRKSLSSLRFIVEEES